MGKNTQIGHGRILTRPTSACHQTREGFFRAFHGDAEAVKTPRFAA
jgi:hypothetical protein